MCSLVVVHEQLSERILNQNVDVPIPCVAATVDLPVPLPLKETVDGASLSLHVPISDKT